jgi:hypothetical protein
MRNYKRGTRKIHGTKADYQSERDTIPAVLQAGETVFPRVYSDLANHFLKVNRLPLPIPSKVEKVMHEFKHRKLKDSSGHIVHNKKQAIAIALDEARKAYKK